MSEGHSPTGERRAGATGRDTQRRGAKGTHILDSVEGGSGQDMERERRARGTHTLKCEGGTNQDMGESE